MPKSRQPYNYTYKPSYQTSSNTPRPTSGSFASGSRSSTSNVASPTSLPATPDPALERAGPSGSVNELLTHLRLTQQPSQSTRDEHTEGRFNTFAPVPTVHPSLQAILGVDQTLPPQPRARGFVVPNSWRTRDGFDPYRRLQDGESTTSSASGFEARGSSMYPNFEVGSAFDLESIAGIDHDPALSLVNLCLRAVARNWTFHRVYDKYYLRDLRPVHKSLLLAHLAAYTISRRQQYVDEGEVLAGSIDKASFELLFRAQFPADTNDGNDESVAGEIDKTLPMAGMEFVTHLNFAGSIGYSISLRGLNRMFSKKVPTPAPAGSTGQGPEKQKQVVILDSWEDFVDHEEEAAGLSLLGPDLRIRHFPNLTHLSLAYPKTSAVSFSDLLKLTKDSVPTITHLSLAGWPTPSSGASSLPLETRVSTNIRHLSQSLICLRYLDVSDCDSDMYKGLEGADWAECWKKVDYVIARQGNALSAKGERVLSKRNQTIMDTEQAVKALRRACKGEMCRFVYTQKEEV
ncbi:uncharacterized protein DFL_004048 [Arthrobotrys flagrans]|uniref:Uncharacterized protein n=1 Tax=Arthrobotrys flagrans TaxID=97331 RepID=A0A437A3K4_ARTFL|nr:hypothetical protein DFL_004048 [Arthrobotrys flagrans]